MILKAGWAAEQLQIVQQDLEREREIRILPSRMAVVRQAEEVRVTEE